MGRAWAEQIPAVAGDVAKNDHASVRLGTRRGDELDAGGPHPFVRGIEVIDPEEEADPARDLVTDCGGLTITVGTGEQDARLGTRWADDDPPLRAPVVGQ
jgi:hypothetical protein